MTIASPVTLSVNLRPLELAFPWLHPHPFMTPRRLAPSASHHASRNTGYPWPGRAPSITSAVHQSFVRNFRTGPPTPASFSGDSIGSELPPGDSTGSELSFAFSVQPSSARQPSAPVLFYLTSSFSTGTVSIGFCF